VPPGLVGNGTGAPYTIYTPFRNACEALPLAEPFARV